MQESVSHTTHKQLEVNNPFLFLFLSFFWKRRNCTEMIVLIFVFLFISFTYGEIVSPTHNYNVTLPEPNAPYVAGQMLPIAYTSPADANIEKRKYIPGCGKRVKVLIFSFLYHKVLQLSVYLTTQDPSLNFTDVLITSNADISQTFSFKRYRLNDVYYEHQLNVREIHKL